MPGRRNNSHPCSPGWVLAGSVDSCWCPVAGLWARAFVDSLTTAGADQRSDSGQRWPDSRDADRNIVNYRGQDLVWLCLERNEYPELVVGCFGDWIHATQFPTFQAVSNFYTLYLKIKKQPSSLTLSRCSIGFFACWITATILVFLLPEWARLVLHYAHFRR